MNCQEVQLQLSGYLERSLDAIRMKGIETHLASCPFCRVEARALADCIAMVSALPPVEPPPGLAQRIMAHAREIELELPVWQRWLGVLRTNMPMQASAVLMIAVFAVAVYHREPGLRGGRITQSSPPPAELQTVQAPDAVAAPAASSARDSGSNRGMTDPPPRVRPMNERTTVSPPPPQSTSESAVAEPRAPAAPDPLELPRLTPRRAPIQAQEISTGRETVRPRTDVFGFGASVGAVDRQPYGVAPFVVGRAPSPLSEPRADFEFIVRRRALERREAVENATADAAPKRAETDAAIASAAAQRAVPAPGGASSAIVEVRWFAVAPHHLEDFRKELAAEATIDAEKGPAGDDQSSAGSSARNLLIKVVILPSDR